MTQIMARLTDKKDMTVIWKEMEKILFNTPEIKYFVFPWNPRNFPIPDPPQLKVTVSWGQREKTRAEVAQALSDAAKKINHSPIFQTKPGVSHRERLF